MLRPAIARCAGGSSLAVLGRAGPACCGCADVFGARQDAEANGFSLITSNAVPGTSGLPSLAAYAADGYTILTF